MLCAQIGRVVADGHFSCRDWEVKNSNNATYFINICGKAKNCDKDVSVCKKVSNSVTNYGSSITKGDLPTSPFGAGFSITFIGNKTKNCTLKTKIHFQCIPTLVSYVRWYAAPESRSSVRLR